MRQIQSTRNGLRKRDESFGLPAWQVAGFSVLFAALLAALFLFPGQFELILGLAVAAAGAGRLVNGHLEAGENDELPPASRAFRQLADPKRPLAVDDPVSVDPTYILVEDRDRAATTPRMDEEAPR